MARTRVVVDTEPKISGELTQSELTSTLSWYSQNKDRKDSLKYAADYLKKHHKITATSALKSKGSTFGFICRILSNGGLLPSENQLWFDKELAEIQQEIITDKPVQVTEKNVINIQERVKEKASECIGELEGLLDDLILSDFKANTSPYATFHRFALKGAHVKHVVDHFKNKRQEFDFVLNTTDKDVKEGYSNFSKPQLKKLVAYCDQVILDCGKVSEDSVKSRKPRKRKVKTPDQIVSKVKICEDFKELNLKSIDVKSILGATQLWVYNTKYRKVGCYQAEDAGGFTIKGTTILNFNESKSIQKKLRKPEVSLPQLLAGGKVFLRNFMESIRAVESPLNGRLNEDIILLKVTK